MSAGPLIIAQAAMTAVSTISSINARNKQASYEAEIAHQQALYQRGLADSQAATMRRTSDRALGSQLAKFAAAGVDPGSGSALLAQQSLAGEAEMEALRIRNQGYYQAFGLDAAARSTLQKARDATSKDYMGLGSHLLGSYGDYQKATNPEWQS